jgi:hypothetical protein
MPRSVAPITDASAIAPLMKLLASTPPPEALGVMAAYLFHATQNFPGLLRPILNEPIVKHGFLGQSLLSELTRVAKS